MFGLSFLGIGALLLILMLDLPANQSAMVAVGLSFVTSIFICGIVVTKIANLHEIVNSRLSELLKETEKAALLVGRQAERSDIMADAYRKQLHQEQLVREARESERQEKR
jgi:hypothetical protein